MASATVSVVVDFNRFAAIADAVDRRALELDAATAAAIVDDYHANAGASGATAQVSQGDGHVLVTIDHPDAAGLEWGGHGQVGNGGLTQATERQRAAHGAALAALLHKE